MRAIQSGLITSERSIFPPKGSLEIVEMDLFDTASVDAAIKGCSDVIHTAASVIIRASNPQKKIVDPSVIGTQNIVDSIERRVQ
jgi:3-beta hydroxysteroid dehydrogenase/isomerase family.